MLDGHAAEPDLLPAVVLSRVVTVLGDTSFFGAAAWVGRRAERIVEGIRAGKRTAREPVANDRHEPGPPLTAEPTGAAASRGARAGVLSNPEMSLKRRHVSRG